MFCCENEFLNFLFPSHSWLSGKGSINSHAYQKGYHLYPAISREFSSLFMLICDPSGIFVWGTLMTLYSLGRIVILATEM